MLIGEVARRAGVSTGTIRFYERHALLRSQLRATLRAVQGSCGVTEHGLCRAIEDGPGEGGNDDVEGWP